MLNLVVNEKGTGDAVLIRAVEPIEGMEIMEQRRGPSTSKIALTNGPGKLTVALGIDMEMDGCVLEPSNHIMRLTKLQDVSADEIYCGPRVGMSKYVAECSHWPWRFYIKDNKWVSKPLIAKYPHW
jgi:DNA-3-methyladenine glycosylase